MIELAHFAVTLCRMPTRLHRYDLPGHTHFWMFSTYRRLAFFWHDESKQIAVDGLRHLQAKFKICLVGYVIMPEHMHVFIYPHTRGESTPLSISILLQALNPNLARKERIDWEGSTKKIDSGRTRFDNGCVRINRFFKRAGMISNLRQATS